MKNKGFSLIEVLMATVVLSVAGAGVYATFIQATRHVQPQRPMAFNAAQKVLEFDIYSKWGEDQWDAGDFTGTVSDTTTSPPVTYTSTNVITDVTQGGVDKDYKKVTVTTVYPALP